MPRGRITPHINHHIHGMILSMMNRRSPRKQRRTFTLSAESLAYLERETRQRKIESQSALLDELLLEKTREQQLAANEAKIRAYYDRLSDQEVEEQRTWGEFAEQNLALIEENTSYGKSAARGDMVRETADRSSRKRKSPGRYRVGQRPKQSSAR